MQKNSVQQDRPSKVMVLLPCETLASFVSNVAILAYRYFFSTESTFTIDYDSSEK